MKKISIILSLVLAWIGAGSASAAIAEGSVANIGTTPVTSMETGFYYTLQNRATGEYLVDNNGTITTVATAPQSGDANAAGTHEYLFTVNAAGNILSADSHYLPSLNKQTISEGTAGDGEQLVKPIFRAPASAAGVYTISGGQQTGYVYLACNGLFLNCDMNGVDAQADYTDWQLMPVTVLGANESSTAYVTYVYKNGTTEWFRQNSIEVERGADYPELYPQPTGVRYTTSPTGKVNASTTFVVQCELTNDNPIKNFSDSYATAKWQFLSFQSNQGHLRYVKGQNYITVNGSQTTRPANTSTNYGYQWAFVGNPFAGYRIVNRLAGEGFVLTSPEVDTADNAGGNTYPVMTKESSIDTKDHNLTWKVQDSQPGFFLARSGENVYMNNRSGKLAYWTYTDGGSRFMVAPVTETITNATIDVTQTYQLVNVKSGKAIAAGNMTDRNTQVNYEAIVYTTDADADDAAQIWQLTKSGTGYVLRNMNTETYLTTNIQQVSGTNYMTSSEDAGTVLYLNQTATAGIYNLTTTTNSAVGQTEVISLADAGGWLLAWTTGSPCSDWQLVSASATEKSTLITNASQLTSGAYYRFVNVGNGRALSEGTRGLNGVAASENSAGQVWKLTKNGSKWQFQNMLSNKYVQASTNTSVNNTYPTGATSPASFTIDAASSENAFYVEGTVASKGLNYNTAYDVVVNWQYSSDTGSHWYIYRVDNSAELLADVTEYQGASNLTNTKMQKYFSDYACTMFNSTYASKTADQIRSAMAADGLPTAIQDMAVNIKNNSWDANSTKSDYIKKFRIADYEIYTNCNWSNITKVGPFAMLYNPTGITVSAGQTLYIFVNDAAKDSDAEILMHIASDTNRYSDQTVTLTKGVNVIYTTATGEVFIDYTLNNANGGTWNGKTVSQYPNIKVHIEGGNCTGMWDGHRGMTNNDWTWLANNMFDAKFLHVKGESTLLNMKTAMVRDASKVKEIMNAWDFVFDTEESLMGCDQWRKTGAYKPMINSRYSYSGNPNWDGGHGTNHPTLSSSYMFNYEGLYNTGQNGGQMWEMSHEIGHGHQNPIKLAGTTEQTNNSLANCVNLLWNEKETTLTKRSDRHDGVKGLLERYNSHHFSWIDYASQRDVNDGYSSLWIANKWFYQLWLYFDHLGNYQPEGGNTGFSFVSELSNKMRESGITYGYSATNPGLSRNDYLKVAKYAAEIVHADLSEYFEVWGFWETEPAVSNDEDVAADHVWHIGDYGNYFLQTNASDAEAVKAEMQAYGNKLTNIIFIEGRGGEDDPWLTYNGQPASSFGETGNYRNFMNGVSEGYGMTVNGNTVTMTDGTGAVGYKIYDAEGNLVWLSNKSTFEVTAEVAQALNNNQMTIYASSGDGVDYALGERGTIGHLTRLIEKAKAGKATIEDIRRMVNSILTIAE